MSIRERPQSSWLATRETGVKWAGFHDHRSSYLGQEAAQVSLLVLSSWLTLSVFPQNKMHSTGPGSW